MKPHVHTLGSVKTVSISQLLCRAMPTNITAYLVLIDTLTATHEKQRRIKF